MDYRRVDEGSQVGINPQSPTLCCLLRSLLVEEDDPLSILEKLNWLAKVTFLVKALIPFLC